MEWWWLETKPQEQTAEQQSKTYINTHCILSHCTDLIWHTSAHCPHLGLLPWRNRNHRCKLHNYNIESVSAHSLIPLQNWPRMIEFIRVWRSSYNTHTHTHTQQTWSCKFEEMKCWSQGNNKKTCHDLGMKPKCRNKITSYEKKPWRRIYICASKLNKNTSKNNLQIYTIPFHLYEQMIDQSLNLCESNDRSLNLYETEDQWIDQVDCNRVWRSYVHSTAHFRTLQVSKKTDRKEEK